MSKKKQDKGGGPCAYQAFVGPLDKHSLLYCSVFFLNHLGPQPAHLCSWPRSWQVRKLL
jgi:hypothetical protein